MTCIRSHQSNVFPMESQQSISGKNQLTNCSPCSINSLSASSRGKCYEELTEHEPPALHCEAALGQCSEIRQTCGHSFSMPISSGYSVQYFYPTRHRVNHLILVAASLKDFWFPIDRVGFLSGRVILFVNLEDKKS